MPQHHRDKIREWKRSAELFQEIAKTQGLYLALVFLADSAYSAYDLQRICEFLPRPPWPHCKVSETCPCGNYAHPDHPRYNPRDHHCDDCPLAKG